MIRPARRRDLDRVLEVERESFSSPWTPVAFASLLHRDRVLFRVAERGSEVVGHGVLWWVVDEGELANIAVASDARGSGVAGPLLDDLLDGARRAGVRTVFLEVRASNDPAIALYLSRGFRDVGLRRGYYEDPKEDAKVMKLLLAESTAALDMTPPEEDG